MRKRYMEMSQQSFSPITARFIRSMDADAVANHVPVKVPNKHIAGEETCSKIVFERDIGNV